MRNNSGKTVVAVVAAEAVALMVVISSHFTIQAKGVEPGGGSEPEMEEAETKDPEDVQEASGETWTADGNTYTGFAKKGILEGQGICEYGNGGRYEGEWADGKRNGKGTYWYSGNDTLKREKYKGEFVDDEYNGQGICYYTDGARYEGEWKDGSREGEGTLKYANDDDRMEYVGQWRKDQPHGTGIFRWKNGAVYEGEVDNDTFHGSGSMAWPDGGKYEGEFVNGYRHGQGTYFYPNGNKYEGEFVNGEYNGTGTFTMASEGRYEGEFVNGFYHGEGTLYDSEGNVEKQGQWINGEFQEK